jgi:phage shock protein PspC (stress-responsive transcriptional regulator)
MSEQNWLQTLRRSDTDKWIGGVCGGLGESSPIPSWAWRLLFATLLICFGTGILLYILLWIFVPSKAKA